MVKLGNSTDRISDAELRRLAAVEQPHCVSIYLGTHRTEPDRQQDSIRLRNLLDSAERQLVNRGMQLPEAQSLLQPGRDLLGNRDFFEHTTDGAAMFLASPNLRAYRTPISFEDRASIAGRFDLVPLLPLAVEDAMFYVLAISPNRARLIRATRHTAVEFELPEIPANFQELSRLADEAGYLEFRESEQTAGPATRREQRFAGAGIALDDRNKRIWLVKYCRLINRSIEVHTERDEETIPMVLACEHSIESIFREASTYANLLEDFAAGLPDQSPADQLRDEAWEVVGPQLTAKRRWAISLFGEAMAYERGSIQISKILPAAFDGRIDTLLVADQKQLWGRFHSGDRKVDLHAEQQPGDEDLASLATTLVLRNAGNAFSIAPDEMPNRADLAAVYRY